MEMTFDQYIQNPMGVANAVFSNRDMYRRLYAQKLNKVLVRELGHIDYTLYKSKSKYYVYMKIPSEVIEKFYYDVVIEFYEPKEKNLVDSTLKNYNVRFYSNDPSFVYTFAHAFMKNKIFINELKDVMSPEAIKKAAVEKNPTNQVGYVKSIYFTYLIMKRENLFNKLKFATAKDIDWKLLNRTITPANIKIAERQNAASDIANKKKKDKAKVKEYIDKRSHLQKDIPYATKSSKRISNTGVTKSTGTIKTSKTIKKK